MKLRASSEMKSGFLYKYWENAKQSHRGHF